MLMSLRTGFWSGVAWSEHLHVCGQGNGMFAWVSCTALCRELSAPLPGRLPVWWLQGAWNDVLDAGCKDRMERTLTRYIAALTNFSITAACCRNEGLGSALLTCPAPTDLD